MTVCTEQAYSPGFLQSLSRLSTALVPAWTAAGSAGSGWAGSGWAGSGWAGSMASSMSGMGSEVAVRCGPVRAHTCTCLLLTLLSFRLLSPRSLAGGSCRQYLTRIYGNLLRSFLAIALASALASALLARYSLPEPSQSCTKFPWPRGLLCSSPELRRPRDTAKRGPAQLGPRPRQSPAFVGTVSTTDACQHQIGEAPFRRESIGPSCRSNYCTPCWAPRPLSR